MPYITYVTDRVTNVQSVGSDAKAIFLGGPSDVKLNIKREDIAALEQRGDDLVVTLQDGTELLIEDFYVASESGLPSRLIVDEGVITAPEISSGLLIAGVLGLAGTGLALGGGGSDNTAAGTALVKIANWADDSSNTANAPTVQDYIDAGVRNVTAGNLVVINGNVAAVTRVDADTLPEIQGLVDVIIEGQVVAGPVVAGNSLVVRVFDQDGQMLGEDTVLDDAGRYSINIGGFRGAVLVQISDTNDATMDYFDEGLMQPKDLTIDLRAVGEIVRGGGIEVNVTALTELSVRQLGLQSGDAGNSEVVLGPNRGVSEIRAANAAVAENFGLDGNPQEVKAIAIVSADGSAAAGNVYGSILAGIAASEKPGLDTNGVIEGLLFQAGLNTSQKAGLVSGINKAGGSDLAVTVGGALKLTPSETQTIVTLAALAKIEAYNNGDGTSPAALTVADYTAAGITGVTAGNLAAVNAKVLAAATAGADTAPEVQALVTAADATLAALAKIEAYNNGDGTSPAALTVADYTAAGITGVTAGNLAAVNAKVLAAAPAGADTAPEVQALVTAADTALAALAKIEAYNNGDGTTPAALTVADYTAAGITGVTAGNLAAVNANVLAAATGGADTAPEVQALVTAADAALATIEAYNNGDGTTPAALTVADYTAAGITGVTAGNLAAVNANVLAAATGGADTAPEVQALVTAADAALATIEAYNNGDGTTPAALTVADYTAAGITGVTAGNLAAVNANVLAAATGGADTAPEVQALVTAADAALATIEAYNNGDGTTPAALTVADYTAAGITGVTAGNLAAVNANVLAAATGGADTAPEVQALVPPAATIDLSAEAGFSGQLIAPVQVLINGVTRTFYYWDVDGSGDSSGVDYITHDDLDSLFNGGADTTDAIGTRSYTMADGTVLRLPTLGTTLGRDVDLDETVASPTQNQTVLDDLAAIKDAFDGVGTSDGTPPGWKSYVYWSATSTGAGAHASLYLNNGNSYSETGGSSVCVALEVV